jgi:hypothetical protein
MSTFNAPPDEINGLTLHNGDTLNVGKGATVNGITVQPGSNLNMGGGTAVGTVLEGVTVSVSGTLVDTTSEGSDISITGTINGITFRDFPSNDPNGPVDELFVETPSSLEGTLTFGVPDAHLEYHVLLGFGVNITSLKDTGSSVTVNYGRNQSLTWHYTAEVNDEGFAQVQWRLLPGGGP